MRRLLVVLLALSLLAAMASTASAATETRTVQGELRFEHGARADDPGNCSAIVFIRWADVPGTTAATAFYTWRGDEKSKGGAPPFDDSYEWVRPYQVEPGYHWIQIGKGWSDGAKPNDCSETSERQKVDYDMSPGATRVELTVEVPDGPSAECVAAKEAASKRAAEVRRAKGRLQAAKGRRAKQRARTALAKAKARHARARALVEQVC
jgi:hypothetical protein